MTLVTTRAVLLRSFPYSETSRVLRFYTDTLGGVGVMARGVRKGSGKGGTALETFAEGALDLHVRETRDLQTLRDFTADKPRRGLAADVRRFGGASVLAELVLKHAGEEPTPALFDALSAGLDALERAAPEDVVATVLRHGWRLVAVLGYRPMIEACVACGAPPGDALVRFDLASGGVRCERCATASGPRLGPGARAQLLALLDDDVLPAVERPGAHLRLLSDFVTWHVANGRPLPSFAVLAGLLGDHG